MTVGVGGRPHADPETPITGPGDPATMSQAPDDADDDDGKYAIPILGVAVGLPVAIVLGLILLIVAVTALVFVVVLLAAVLGSFVLGVGGDVSSPPQAQFTFDYADGSGQVTVTHAGGDSIQADSLVVEVDGDRRGTWADLGGHDTVEAGDTVDVTNVENGDTIRILYLGEEGRSVLTVYEVGN